jgi:hypothetical protein
MFSIAFDILALGTFSGADTAWGVSLLVILSDVMEVPPYHLREFLGSTGEYQDCLFKSINNFTISAGHYSVQH